MFAKRAYRFVVLAVALALLAASLPLGSTSALGSPQYSQADCPPVEPALAQQPDFFNSLPSECRKGYYQIDGGEAQLHLSITPQLTGGPDTYGYTWDDGVPHSWVDTGSGTNTGLSGWGGGTGPIALPFSFKYYDNVYDSVYITSYGFLSFHDYSPWDPQSPIPDPDLPNDVIAPYWTPSYIPSNGWIHYQSGGIAPDRYFVVEWRGLSGGPASDPDTGDERYNFEVVLYENGDIEFRYALMAYGGIFWCASAGLENSTGLDGVTYRSLCSGFAPSYRTVHFYRPATGSFIDVSSYHWAYAWIERLYNAGITGGCGTNPLRYCPGTSVTRAQMAVFLLKGIHASSYTPPPVGASTGFEDVPPDYWAAAWIKQLAVEKITGGCGAGNYCPDYPVTRAQMAVFLLKAKHGTSYTPPPVGTGTGFSDVPADYWAAAWIKQLAAEGITGGCGAGVYCPESPVTRDQMAVFLVKTFNLP